MSTSELSSLININFMSKKEGVRGWMKKVTEETRESHWQRKAHRGAEGEDETQHEKEEGK
jgi:hypothetical protein